MKPVTFVRHLSALLLFWISSSAVALTFMDVWEYRVEGNTLLSAETIEQAVSPYLGEARKVADVDLAVKALQQEYRQAGYPTAFVELPAQDVVAGVVILKVNEAQVRRVRVAGNRYFAISGIRDMVPSLTEKKSIHLPTLQSEVQKANKINRDLKLVPVVKQGPTAETIDVDLNIADKAPVHGGLEINSYHTEQTTPQRFNAHISYNNLWQKHHELGLQMQVSPQNTDEVNVLAASYMIPFLNGNRLALYGVRSDSEIASVSDVNVLGNGTILGFRFILPFAETTESLHSLALGMDYKDYKEDVVLASGETEQAPIEYLSWSALYTANLRREKIHDQVDLGLTLGIRDLVNKTEEFAYQRSEAQANFFFLETAWKRSYLFENEWVLSHRLRAQLSDSPLVSNEQVNAGGRTVRGYYESQIQGDYGLLYNLSLQTPDLTQEQWPWVSSLVASLFYEGAMLRLKEPLPDQDDHFNISSIGVALAGQLWQHWFVDLDSGLALQQEGEVDQGEMMTRASLRYEF